MTQDEMYKLIAERDGAIMRAMLANQRADSADKQVDELTARAERAEADNLDNILAALGMNADEARRLREENARLRAQLAAMQVAACPECGVTLAGKLLAPFGRSEGPDYSFRIAVDCAAPDEEGWRPVTEPPTGTAPVEVVIRAEYIVGNIADLKNNLTGWWLATSVRSGVIIAPISWRPAAPDEEARP